VGDGLVSQIPAVIISVAAALLLAKGSQKGAADVSFFAQLGRYPGALGTVALLMALFALVPGMPFLPFMLAPLVLGAAALARRAPAPRPAPPPRWRRRNRVRSAMCWISTTSTSSFRPTWWPWCWTRRPGLMPDRQHAQPCRTAFGFILPEIRLTDEAPCRPAVPHPPAGRGTGADRLYPDRVLVLLSTGVPAPDGLDAREPVYGAPARWIPPDQQEDAALSGLTVVSPTEVLATHLLEVLKSNLSRLLTLRGLRRLLDEFVRLSDPVRAEANRRLLDELVPDKVPLDLLARRPAAAAG
jgi:flagellar biosynthesis protein FlhA